MMLQSEFVLEQLNQDGLVIMQPRKGYRFSLDAVLLARFPEVKAGYKIIDLGTGSGVIPLLLTTREDKVFIQGVEIQPRLAKLAKDNVEINNRQATIKILEQDINSLSSEWNGQWDLVVSNPPYFKAKAGKISQGERAIARHELKCTLEDIIRLAARLLKPKGHLALVHRVERLPETMSLLARFNLNPWRLKVVHPRSGENGELFLLEAVKAASFALNILPPLIIYNKEGKYTPAMEEIYAGCNI